MLIKRKSIAVIIFSSIVLSVVVLATLAGFYLYVSWKEKEGEEIYLEKLGTVQAKIYSKYLVVSNLNCKIGKTHPFKGKPVLEGKIENAGNWTIRHIVLKVSFPDSKNESIYDIKFEPLKFISKKENIKIPFIEIILREEELPLKPSEKVEFTYTLENVPMKILNSLQEGKLKYEKNVWTDKLKYDLLRIRFF